MPQFSKKKVVFSLFCPLFLVTVVAFLTAEGNVLPQAQTLSAATNNETVDTAKTTPTNAGVTKTALTRGVFASPAVSRNANLKMNMNWTFGGKTQRGWYLYEPLIHQLLNLQNTDDDFVNSLSAWQKTSGLTPNGELNESAFAVMVKHWQSQRLKSLEYAKPEELMTVSVTEFWDSARPIELRQVEKETYAAYKRMIAAAAADKTLNLRTNADGTLANEEKFLKIISAFRSREYQLKLRQADPNAGRAALAVHSPHFTGRALDIYVGGEPVITKDANRLIQINTPVYQWLVKNAHRFGFRPYFYEPWHWEYVGTVEK